jgi:type I restriction modification DNA specificity domain protein
MINMKDSGVEWIGRIPKGWKVLPIKSGFLYQKLVAGDSHEKYPRLTLAKAGVLERPKYDGNGQSPANYSTYQIVPEGELVFNLMGLEQDSDYRRVGIPPKDGLLSSGYVRLDHNSDVVFNRFALYYFLDLEARRIFNSYGTGIRSTLNGSQLVKIPMIFPPISEQQQIAKFLDEKTALIDGIITDTKQTIEELKSYKQSLISEIVTKGINKNVKLVPSGIEWIGEIPKGWKTIPLKLVFNEIGSGTTPDTSQSEFYGDKIYWIQSGDLYQKKYVEDTKKKISDKGLNSSSALKIYKSPFIAVAMYGASIGNISISKIDSCVNQAVAVMSNPILLELEFAYYCLFISKEFLILESKGGTQPNISQEILKNWKIPLPTVDEQKMIIEILDKKTNKIDMIIKEKEKIISEYENYKKSMIYEYVTGKKRVDIDEGDLN